ncbi:G-protein-signaling modulator 2-like [Actinia tenebrosa]|uniref:G-protein-signaling modulator 2-like n=1 Tax=Actinia tenebrosa TaxID=6105 RepID=A0A6P8IM51_ACTTE|nr:G-protein-signaling modulator 2-like [Actinia tenebrosa]
MEIDENPPRKSSLIVAKSNGEDTKQDDSGILDTTKFKTLEEQVKFYERRIRSCHKAKQKEKEGDELCNLGILYYKAGRLQDARHCHERHLNIAKSIRSPRSEKRAYCNLGCTYRRLGNLDRAIECYEEGLKLAKELGDRTGEGKLINNLANIFEQKGDFDQAVCYHQRRLKLAKELNDLDAESKSCASIGNIHHLLGNIRESIAYYERLVASLKFKLAQKDKKAAKVEANCNGEEKDDHFEDDYSYPGASTPNRRNSDSISVNSSKTDPGSVGTDPKSGTSNG